jgi:hypothetical protein
MHGRLQNVSSFTYVVSLTKEQHMPDNLHAIAIPAATLAEIRQHIAAAYDLARTYVTSRTPEERGSMLILGPKSLSFVERAHEYARQNPQLCPPFLDMEAFDIDFSDAHGLWGIRNLVQQLHEGIDDTQIVAGSEAYQAALLFYNSAKTAAAQNVPGAKAIYDDLKNRFPRGKRRPPATGPTPETVE